MKIFSTIRNQVIIFSKWFFRLSRLKLDIERKTDMIALAAFIMALGGLLFQLLVYFRGPVIHSFPPDQITIRPKMFPDGQEYVTFVASMAYVNVGYKDYHGTIKRERLQFKLNGKTYEQLWHQFVHIDSNGIKLIEKVSSPAGPMPVMAGGSKSHDTAFLPRLVRCRPGRIRCDPNINYLSWKAFLRKIANVAQLRLLFTTEIYNEQPIQTVCYIDIYPTLRMQLIDQKWAGVNCWEKT